MRREHEHIQIACLVCKLLFYRLYHPKVRQNRSFLYRLTATIFNDCSQRRMLLNGALDILMVFPDEESVKKQKSLAREWLRNPSTLLTRAKEMNTTLLKSEFQANLSYNIRRYFSRNGTSNSNTCSHARQHVILRLVVLMKLEEMDTGSGNLSKSKHLLSGQRVVDSLLLKENHPNSSPPLPADVSFLLSNLLAGLSSHHRATSATLDQESNRRKRMKPTREDLPDKIVNLTPNLGKYPIDKSFLLSPFFPHRLFCVTSAYSL
jgi:hypothetical protein